MKKTQNKGLKGDKREVRQEMHLTRPPRLEGKVKNAMMNPVRKKKAAKKAPAGSRKAMGLSAAQGKAYQLPTRPKRK